MPRKSWWARLPFGVRMTAGACAMFVIVGGGVAGAVSTMTAPGSSGVSGQDVGPDPGAPRLEEDPEVVSRAAAAAEPLPPRHGETTAPTPAPAGAATAGESTAAPATGRRAPGPGRRNRPGREAGTDHQQAGPGRNAPAPVRKAPVPHVAAAADQLSRARTADDRADRTGPRRDRTLAQAPALRAAAAAPVVTTRTDVETRAIPFDTKVIRDPSMLRGTRRVETRGAAGERTLRYLVTLIDGRQTSRRLLGSTVTRQPKKRVVVVGSARHIDPGVECDAILGICLPFGRTAMACPGDGTTDPVAPAVPWADVTADADSAETLIAEEELELLGRGGLESRENPEDRDGAYREPATLC
ncbi:G5 domain-containing protein [Actinoplanes xinjiangensis]|uniref:G5 domain-containing protein n=1 Tax=Actinoplanes xinjiangensis TaxID=512350 RepID=UPI003438E61F